MIKAKPQIQQCKSNPIAQWAQCPAYPRSLLGCFGAQEAQSSSSAICSTQRCFPRVKIALPPICHCIWWTSHSAGTSNIVQSPLHLRPHLHHSSLLASLQGLWTHHTAPGWSHLHDHSFLHTSCFQNQYCVSNSYFLQNLTSSLVCSLALPRCELCRIKMTGLSGNLDGCEGLMNVMRATNHSLRRRIFLVL